MGTQLTAGISVSVPASEVRPLLNIAERAPEQVELLKRQEDAINANLRVMMPAKIVSFDAATQRATVQPLFRERIIDRSNGNLSWSDPPVLPDLPVCFPKFGNFVLTMPPQEGDECVVGFADLSIESWKANGDLQNWVDRRRHDWSDGVVYIGISSTPNAIPNFNEDAAELRTIEHGSKITIKNDELSLVRQDPLSGLALASVLIDEQGVHLSGVAVKITAATLILAVADIISESDDPLIIQAASMFFNALGVIGLNGTLQINGSNYLSHRHGGVQTGGGTSAGVTP